jgi:fumarate reductase subunit C
VVEILAPATYFFFIGFRDPTVLVLNLVTLNKRL